MRTIPAMVDMARTKAEKEDTVATKAIDAVPDYPYGLSISLCQDELEKLDLDEEDLEVGDMIHLHCMTKITSVSSTDNEAMGPQKRVELQITHISAEDEETEGEGRLSKLYS